MKRPLRTEASASARAHEWGSMLALGGGPYISVSASDFGRAWIVGLATVGADVALFASEAAGTVDFRRIGGLGERLKGVMTSSV